MSKYVKNLLTDHLRSRLQGVDDALLVDMIGLSANTNNQLRRYLETKNIHVAVVKNSVGRRAIEGMRLASMLDDVRGTTAICWGSEDIVSLAKEVTKIARNPEYAPFGMRGGVMDGEKLSPEQVVEVSRLPSREGQLAILAGQILSPGARLASQLCGVGEAIAGQVAKMIEDKEKAEPAPAETAPAAVDSAAAPTEAAPEGTNPAP
jgi:large subunit ribosomal protein L10